MKKRFIVLFVGLLSLCVALVGASRVAQPPSAGITGGGGGATSGVTRSDDVVAAQKKLVIDAIAKDDAVAAEAACWQLVNQPTPHALHEIVEEADTLGKLSEVYQVYLDMIIAKPNDPQVIWLKTGLGVAEVHLGDDQAVEATLLDIVANHGSDDRVVEALGQIAWAYRKLQRYDNALSINQYTVDNWPQGERVAYAQQGIVLCQIGLGNFAAADKALDVQVQKFGKDADASKLVLWSGFGYDDAKQKDGAYHAYGLVVQNYPDAPEAVVAQLRRALAGVEAEDPNRMEENIQTLLTQFAPTQDQGASLRTVADTLFWKRFGFTNQSAKQDIVPVIDGYLETIADYTLANWPQSDWGLWSQRDLAVVAIQRGDDSAAEGVLQRMVADYPAHPKLPEAVFQVGEQYWNMAGVERAKSLGLGKGKAVIFVGGIPALPEEAQAGYSSAKRVWQRIADELPTSATTVQAVFFVGESCRSLEQYQEAMAAYQKVVDQWPDYEHAWMAQDRIVKGYQDMARLGSMSVYDSEAAMSDAYARMLRLFPNCPVASRAREWLNSRQGKGETQLRQEAAQRQQFMNLARSRAN